ncbi:hypothetical protein [Allomesorhizobium camelthorni]|uniref:Uncharacterized protein n=1 Tax=Allomesorhizobium camelthorni TaxID=475069 RepID=A0A6G4WDD3_9HYPH|nr:hypothetical protein [Mesorhizobium camelthorni]
MDLAAGLPAALPEPFAGAAFAVDFAAADFAAAGLADVDLPAAGLAEVLPAGLGAVALAAGCLDAAGFAADFAGATFAVVFAVADFAAVLAVDFVTGFDAAGFEVLAADGFAIVLFATGLAVAFTCLAEAALAGFVVPVFVGVAGLDGASAGFAFGAAVLFVVLANFASLVFSVAGFLSFAAAPSQLFRPSSICCEIEPKTIVPPMYCDKVAARKPCLCVSFGMIFLVEQRLNSGGQSIAGC